MDEGGPESHSHAETSPSAPRGRAPAHDVPDSSAIVPTVPMGGGGGGGGLGRATLCQGMMGKVTLLPPSTGLGDPQLATRDAGSEAHAVATPEEEALFHLGPSDELDAPGTGGRVSPGEPGMLSALGCSSSATGLSGGGGIALAAGLLSATPAD